MNEEDGSLTDIRVSYSYGAGVINAQRVEELKVKSTLNSSLTGTENCSTLIFIYVGELITFICCTSSLTTPKLHGSSFLYHLVGHGGCHKGFLVEYVSRDEVNLCH